MLSDHQSFIVIVVEKWAQSILLASICTHGMQICCCFDCIDGVFFLFNIIWTLVYTTTVALWNILF